MLWDRWKSDRTLGKKAGLEQRTPFDPSGEKVQKSLWMDSAWSSHGPVFFDILLFYLRCLGVKKLLPTQFRAKRWAIRDWWQAGIMFTCLAKAQPTVRQGVAQCVSWVSRTIHCQDSHSFAFSQGADLTRYTVAMEKVLDNHTRRLLRRELLRRSTAALWTAVTHR